MNKFSVILPVRNGGQLIKQCVGSILRQTFPDFNLYILDNCSDDGTYEWVHSLNDERIIIERANKTLSIEENWGRVLSIPKNEFMTMIGHDDIFDKDYLQTMDDLIKRYPQASLYQAHFRYIDSVGTVLRHCKPMTEVQTVDQFLHNILTDAIDTMGTGYMMRSEHYNAVGGIPMHPNLLFADHELWLKLTAINYKATTQKECFSFRIHQSISKTSDAVRYTKAFFRFLDYLLDTQNGSSKIKSIIEADIVNYIRYYCRSLSHRLLKTPLKQRQGMKVDSFVQQCKIYADKFQSKDRFEPYKQLNLRFSKLIDSTSFFRELYLLFRKIYKKPIYR